MQLIQYPMSESRSETKDEQGRQWHYINLEEFEEMVRNEERVRLFNERMQERHERKAKETREIKRHKYFTAQKLMGALVILATFLFREPFVGLNGILTIINIIAGLILIASKKKLLCINK